MPDKLAPLGAQYRAKHRRGRRLAVRTGNRDRLVKRRRDERQKRLALHTKRPRFARGGKLGVVPRDRRGVDDERARRGIAGIVPKVGVYPVRGKHRKHARILSVRPADVHPPLAAKQRERLHADAADADEMYISVIAKHTTLYARKSASFTSPPRPMIGSRETAACKHIVIWLKIWTKSVCLRHI